MARLLLKRPDIVEVEHSIGGVDVRAERRRTTLTGSFAKQPQKKRHFAVGDVVLREDVKQNYSKKQREKEQLLESC